MLYIMGIDLGTSSVKAVIIDLLGHVLGMGQKEYSFDIPFDGWAEQDADVYWNSTVEAIHISLKNSKVDPNDIYCLGFSGQMHGLVTLDSNNKPIRKAIIWCDQRSKKQVKEIQDKIGKEKLAKIAHSPIATGFQTASLVWLKANEPDNYSRIKKIILPKDYIRFKLTGVISTDLSDAAGTLALNCNTGKWSKEIISKLGLDISFYPEIFMPKTIIGNLTRESSELTGLSRVTLVAHGGADQAMQAVGSGIIKPGSVSFTIGTGGQVFSPLSKPLFDNKYTSHTFNFLTNNSWYYLGATLSAGLSLKWYRNNFAQPISYEYMDFGVEKSHVGSNGLIFLPYLGGERTPYLNPNARAILFGMTHNSNKNDVYRAIMEGVVFSLYDCLGILVNQMGQKANIITASGGGAKSKPWRKIISDVTGVPVQTSLIKEQASVGAAITAAVGCGLFSSYEEGCSQIVTMGEDIINPNMSNYTKYQEYYQIYKELYKNTATLMNRMANN